MAYFRIIHKGITHFIEADINQQALSQLGIASTADYQLKKITKEVYETGIKTKPPVTEPINVPFKMPDVAWTPVGEKPAKTTPTTPTTVPGDVDYSRATPAAELTPGGTGEERFGAYEPPPTPTPTDTTGGWTNAQTAEYEAYQATVDSGLYPNLIKVSNQEEYWKVANQLTANEGYYFSSTEGTLAQWEEWERFQAFGSKYGDLNDYSPDNFADFINNYSQAQQQLNTWTTEAGPEATGFLDDQIREFYDFKAYQSQYGEAGDWKPVDIGDFFTNYDQAQQQLGVWQQMAGEVEQYAVDPAEAARRREEAYEESRYAAEERYRETPRYGQAFSQWLGGQEEAGGALQEFIEREFPSLRTEFQATQPRLTGFPTREAARAEAGQREQAWQGWLGEMTPEIEQRYYAQRPAERGERLWMQAPTTVTKNW